MLVRTLAFAALLLAPAVTPLAAGERAVEMWRTTGCSCCAKWAGHLERQGYQVAINDAAAGVMARIKRQAGIPEAIASCHTAKIEGYAIEGHVPVEDVERLLTERPDAIGLAVPGMPLGSPGMEADGESEPYEVLLVKKDGSTEVWARH